MSSLKAQDLKEANSNVYVLQLKYIFKAIKNTYTGTIAFS